MLNTFIGLDQIDYFLAESKVSIFEVSVFVYVDIAGFHVTVDDSFGVHVHKAFDEVLAEGADYVFGNCFILPNQLQQI